MNINLLANNPAWWYFPIIVIPATLTIGMGFYLLKYGRPRWLRRSRSKLSNQDEEHLLGDYRQDERNSHQIQLLRAAECGHEPELTRLLKLGVKIKLGASDVDFRKSSPVCAAIINGHSHFFEALILAAEPLSTHSVTGSIVHWIASLPVYYPEILDYLLARGFVNNISAHNWAGETTLHIAAENGYTMLIRQLVKQCGDLTFINKTNKGGWTALYLCKDVESLQALLEHGADANLQLKLRRWVYFRTMLPLFINSYVCLLMGIRRTPKWLRLW